MSELSYAEMNSTSILDYVLMQYTGVLIFLSSRHAIHDNGSTIVFTILLLLALCVLHWGRLSDRIGRRPVLLIGLTGLAASMLSFGFAKSFSAIVFSRLIAGVLNGNVGVAKTIVSLFINILVYQLKLMSPRLWNFRMTQTAPDYSLCSLSRGW